MNQSQKAVNTLKNRIIVLITIAIICVAVFVYKNKDDIESGIDNSRENVISYPISAPSSFAE